MGDQTGRSNPYCVNPSTKILSPRELLHNIVRSKIQIVDVQDHEVILFRPIIVTEKKKM